MCGSISSSLELLSQGYENNELACGISKRVAEQAIRDWLNSKHQEY
jgi:hypothetical protein